MNYDKLMHQINELGNGNQELGSICFLQQRGILHQERSCEKCETDMRMSTAEGPTFGDARISGVKLKKRFVLKLGSTMANREANYLYLL